jgi:alkylation response protein AidB-like acyl-CoA dehydrogenase
MHLELTPAQDAFRAEVEAFAREHVVPHAAGIDESNAFPVSLVREAASRGLLGIAIPREHGGRDRSDRPRERDRRGDPERE